MTSHTTKRVHLFFLGRRKRLNFFIRVFPSCSQSIPNNVLQVTHDVPQVPNVFPQGVSNSKSLYPMSFAQSSPLCHLYKLVKVEALHPHIEIAILGSLPSFFFGMMYQSKWPITKIKKKSWEPPHLMKRRGQVLIHVLTPNEPLL